MWLMSTLDDFAPHKFQSQFPVPRRATSLYVARREVWRLMWWSTLHFNVGHQGSLPMTGEPFCRSWQQNTAVECIRAPEKHTVHVITFPPSLNYFCHTFYLPFFFFTPTSCLSVAVLFCCVTFNVTNTQQIVCIIISLNQLHSRFGHSCQIIMSVQVLSLHHCWSKCLLLSDSTMNESWLYPFPWRSAWFLYFHIKTSSLPTRRSTHLIFSLRSFNCWWFDETSWLTVTVALGQLTIIIIRVPRFCQPIPRTYILKQLDGRCLSFSFEMLDQSGLGSGSDGQFQFGSSH